MQLFGKAASIQTIDEKFGQNTDKCVAKMCSYSLNVVVGHF